MRKERGFIPGLSLYPALGAAVVIGIMGVTIAVYRSSLASCRANHERFVAEVKVKGELAQAKANAENTRLLTAKEKADEQASNLVAELNRVRRELRDSRGAVSRLVPRVAEAANAIDPAVACYERDPFGDAVQRFVEGVQELVEEGSEYQIDSRVARGWIKSLSAD